MAFKSTTGSRIDTNSNPKFETGLATRVNQGASGAGNEVILRFQFRLRPTTRELDEVRG